MPSFICRALSGMPLQVHGDGSNVIDLIHVDEVARILVDALDAPTGVVADMIEAIRAVSGHVLSLDIPSGIHGDTGEAPGVAVRPDQTLTLALPKTGLMRSSFGELWLADLGIPAGSLRRAGVEVTGHIFEDGPLIPLVRRPSQP